MRTVEYTFFHFRISCNDFFLEFHEIMNFWRANVAISNVFWRAFPQNTNFSQIWTKICYMNFEIEISDIFFNFMTTFSTVRENAPLMLQHFGVQNFVIFQGGGFSTFRKFSPGGGGFLRQNLGTTP